MHTSDWRTRLSHLGSRHAWIGWMLTVLGILWKIADRASTAQSIWGWAHNVRLRHISLPSAPSAPWIMFFCGITWLTVVVFAPELPRFVIRRMFTGNVELIHAAFMRPVGGTLDHPIVEYREFMRLYITKKTSNDISIRTFELRVTPKANPSEAASFEADRRFPKRIAFETWVPRGENPNDVTINRVDYGNSLVNLMESATGKVLGNGETAHGWLIFTIPTWRWTLSDCTHELFAVDAVGNKHEIPIINPQWESGSAKLQY